MKDAFIDGKLIKPQCFAHILPKGMYPRFRLLPDNIALVHDFECHKLIDQEYNDLEKRRNFESVLILTTKIPKE